MNECNCICEYKHSKCKVEGGILYSTPSPFFLVSCLVSSISYSCVNRVNGQYQIRIEMDLI